MPRHIWPEDQALVTLPPSTWQSMRRWPSMRVIGSMVILATGSLLSKQLFRRPAGHAP